MAKREKRSSYHEDDGLIAPSLREREKGFFFPPPAITQRTRTRMSPCSSHPLFQSEREEKGAKSRLPFGRQSRIKKAPSSSSSSPTFYYSDRGKKRRGEIRGRGRPHGKTLFGTEEAGDEEERGSLLELRRNGGAQRKSGGRRRRGNPKELSLPFWWKGKEANLFGRRRKEPSNPPTPLLLFSLFLRTAGLPPPSPHRTAARGRKKRDGGGIKGCN